MKTKLAGALVLIGALSVLAACGGGSSSSSSSTSDTAADTTATTTSTGDVTAFCDNARGFKSLGDTFTSLSSDDVEGAKSAFQDGLGQVQDLDDSAPAEIKPAADKLLSSYSNINDAIQGVDTPEDLKALGPQLQGDLTDLQSSADDIDSYASQNC
jgi:hypothetical protein